MIARPDVFVDPTPLTPSTLSDDEMATIIGGALPFIVVVIVTCGGKLGAATVVTAGTAVVTVIDAVQE
jgi:bacteriocin-like protein